MNSLEYQLDDPGEVTKDINIKKYIIIISLLILVILILATLFIIELIRAQNLSDDKDDLNKDIIDLKNEVSNLNNSIPNLTNEISNLKNDQENLKKENNNLIRKNEILKYNLSVDVGSDMLLFTFGKILINLSYTEDNVIINSFVKNGNNFIEEVGEIE